MKKSLIALAVAISACTVAVAAPAKATAKKPAAAKKAPAKKTPAKKATTKKRKATAKSKAAVTTPTVTQAPTIVPGAAGQLPVYTGEFACDTGRASVQPHGDEFAVKAGHHSYTMHRVPTSSGVVRLEAAGNTAYWLQMGNKSMLIDTKAGGRVADGCRNEQQRAREEEIKRSAFNLLN